MPRRAVQSASTQPASPARAVPLRWRLACTLGVCCFAAYLTNLRPMGAQDTIPARLLPFSILREGNLDLDEFHWLRPGGTNPYFLKRGIDGHWHGIYPVATSVLLTPLYVPVVWWLLQAQISDDDVRFRLATVVMERLGAALLAGLSVAALFLALSTLASAGTALAVALAYAFGTSTWAISSQALWQHAGVQLSLAGMSLCLLRPDTRRTSAAAGAWAALGVLVRPTMVIFAVLALVYVWRDRRPHLLAFLAVPFAAAGLLLLYNLGSLGSVQGGYQPSLELPAIDRALGLLLSPNRGLFVFTPAAALAVPALVLPRYRRRAWLAYLAVGVAGYVLFYSSFEIWWAGSCYGPRYLSDGLPALALLAVPAGQRLRDSRPGRALLLGLVGSGVVVQVIGVYFDDGSWNAWPTDVTAQRTWDWRDPHILRAAHAGWHGTDLAPLLWQTLVDPRPALLRPLTGAELAGRITVESAPQLRYRNHRTTTLNVSVTNSGPTTWPAFSDFAYRDVAVLYRWWVNEAIVRDVGGPLPPAAQCRCG